MNLTENKWIDRMIFCLKWGFDEKMQKQDRIWVIRHTVFPDEPSNTARNVLQIPANSTQKTKDILIDDSIGKEDVMLPPSS